MTYSMAFRQTARGETPSNNLAMRIPDISINSTHSTKWDHIAIDIELIAILRDIFSGLETNRVGGRFTLY